MAVVISSFPRVFCGVKTAEEQARFFKKCGYTHGDLLIRDNFFVNSDSPAEAFQAVYDTYEKEGVRLYSAITDLNAPCENMEKILDFCGRHNICKIKIGPYRYYGNSYRNLFAKARTDLTGLESLSKRYGVQILVQNHGGTIHSSPSLSRALVEELDPDKVAIYYDAGNMMNGDGHEAWALGIDIAGKYLSHVGIKNVHWFKKSDGKWSRDFCRLRDGIIDYCEVLGALKAAGYSGDYSVHTFYVPDGSIHEQSTIENAAGDLAYFKELLKIWEVMR
ncbi:MAG: sugar phosphate isomerase/epimerase [Oscillospiraceae bacterium]|nr:sugar phosphate isomerase/epimerase [Oscillospiraceae bacterium]